MTEEISWQAYEFEYHRKDIGWYYLVAIAAIIFVAVAVWQQNYLFAAFLVIAAGMVMYWGMARPRIVSISVTEKGVRPNQHQFIPMSELLGFALKEDGQDAGEWGIMLLRSRHRLAPYIKLPIPRGKMEQVRALLHQHLDEFEYDESLIDEVLRWLRF